MTTKDPILEKELAKKAVRKKETKKRKKRATPEEVALRKTQTVKCKGCDTMIPTHDSRGRKKHFCSVGCCAKTVGESNLKFTEEFVEKELEDMWKYLNEVPFILFIKELFEFKEYSYDNFSRWVKMFPNNPTISQIIKQIVEVTEIRQVRAGIFGVVNVLRKDPYAGPDEKVYFEQGKEVNSSFMKFVMMNHHNYRNKEDSENKNLNVNQDANSIMKEIWDQNDKQKTLRNF